MVSMNRVSPVTLPAAAAKTEERDGWTVVLEYEAEGPGPHLIDLSHRPKWDVQDINLSGIAPWGIKIPEEPGNCVYDKGILINRMNRTQASIWHLFGMLENRPEGSAFTDMTDAVVCLALTGKELPAIVEKLCPLDLFNPKKTTPYLTQGPFAHVPCQLVLMNREANGSALIFTCSRGYARDMVHAVLQAGNAWGIRPAGENALREILRFET